MEVDFEEGDICPKCKHHLDAVTPIGRSATKVEAGDITVCAYCGTVLVLTDNKGHLHLITEEEEEKLDDATRDMLNIIQTRIKDRNRSQFAM